jgi:Spy/CpxP family protein refolding chaperone
MKKLAFSTVLAALLGVAAFSMADAQDQEARTGRRGPGFGPGFGRGPMMIARVVDLTDAQRAQIREILETARKERQGPPPSVALHRQLEGELLADTPDLAKIETLKSQIAQAEADQLAKRVELQTQIAAVLTPEQRAKAREALAKTPQGGPDGGRRQGRFLRR